MNLFVLHMIAKYGTSLISWFSSEVTRVGSKGVKAVCNETPEIFFSLFNKNCLKHWDKTSDEYQILGLHLQLMKALLGREKEKKTESKKLLKQSNINNLL